MRQFLSRAWCSRSSPAALGVLLALWALDGDPVDRRGPAAAEHDAHAELAGAGVHRARPRCVTRCSSASCRRCRRRAPSWSRRLKDSARGSSSERSGRFRAMLIVGEVALSVVLLVGSALLLDQLHRAAAHAAGVRAAEARRRHSSACRPDATRRRRSRREFFNDVIARLETQPQVSARRRPSACRCPGFNPRSPYSVGGRPVLPLPQRPLANLGDRQRRLLPADAHLARDGPRVHRRRPRGRARRLHHQRIAGASGSFPANRPLGKILLRGTRRRPQGGDRRRDPRRQDERAERAGA